jgi:hypothetical protein
MRHADGDGWSWTEAAAHWGGACVTPPPPHNHPHRRYERSQVLPQAEPVDCVHQSYIPFPFSTFLLKLLWNRYLVQLYWFPRRISTHVQVYRNNLAFVGNLKVGMYYLLMLYCCVLVSNKKFIELNAYW